MIVVDASALLEVLLRTPNARAIEGRLFDNGEDLHAPHLIDIEVAQAIRRYERERGFETSRAEIALANLAAFPLHRHAHTNLLPRMWSLRGRISAYDATYVALAEALGAALITCDRRLVNAGGHQAYIELL